MKAVMIALVVCVTGCSDNGVKRAAYVRDKSHNCTVEVHVEPHFTWSYIQEKPVKEEVGRKVYRCDGGLVFGIDDNEVQP